jgi:fatty-acid desaturase
MMEPVKRIITLNANALEGQVVFDVKKALWNLVMIISALILAPMTFSFSALVVFLVLTYMSLLVGHSAGMHRLMIHRSWACTKGLERVLIYIGVLVGMSGPFTIIKIHDLRDWAQRQSFCHDFFSHKQGYFKDIWWQLTCQFKFVNSPQIVIESHFYDDVFYQWLEKTWRYQQILPGVLLYFLGGWNFIVWGVIVRVAVSILGHWSITYFCHNPGPGVWRVKGAAVQASNIPGLGLLTYGECWHNNHHAFPESAKIGLQEGQSDPTWWFINLLTKMGLTHYVGAPRSIDLQDDLYRF